MTFPARRQHGRGCRKVAVRWFLGRFLVRASKVLKTFGPDVGLLDNKTQQAYADFVSQGIAAARAPQAHHVGGQLFAEAETGSGKTIGYLVAAGLDCVQHGCRAIVATHTLSLQRQIINFDDAGNIAPDCDMSKAIALVEKATGRRLTAALRFGRRNFADADRVQTVVERMLRGKSKRRDHLRHDLEALASWALANPGGEFRDFLEDEGMDNLPGGLAQEDICVDADSDRKGPSWLAYRSHASKALSADIVVTNHALLIRQALSSKIPILVEQHDTRKVGALVVDECDRLESAAVSATSDLLPLMQFRGVVAQWNMAYPDGRAQSALRAATALYDMMYGLHDDLHGEAQDGQESLSFWDDLPKSLRGKITDALRALGTALTPLMTSPPLDDDEDGAQAGVRDYARSLAAFWETIHDEDGKGIAALRWSPDRRYPSMRTMRLHPARVLKAMWRTWTVVAPDAEEAKSKPTADLFPLEAKGRDDPRRAAALVLTSATISAPTKHGKADTTEMSQTYGIWPASNACDSLNRQGMIFAPTTFGSVDLVLSDPGAAPVYLEETSSAEDGEQQRDINPAWVEYVARMTLAAFRQGGRCMVLTNSYRTTEMIGAALRRVGIDPIEKTRAMLQTTAVRRFAAQPNGVFVTPGSWEGLDLSQHIGPDGLPAKIKHIVMTQIPFARADGAYGAALKRHLMRHGRSAETATGILYAMAQSAALRKARQGFGRGIRGPSDSFTLLVADVRFPRPMTPIVAAMPATPGVRTLSGFANIIPLRFRKSLTGDETAWDSARVFKVDGTLVDLSAD